MTILALRTDRISRRMAYSWLALALLAASLALPSFEFTFMGSTSLVSGWAAAWFGMLGAIEGIAHLLSGEAMTDFWAFLVAGSGAILNLIFLAAPVMLRKRVVTRRSLTILGVLAGVGFALGCASSLLFADAVEHFLIGYQLWLCAYLALGAAILAAWLGDRPQGMDQ